MSYVLDKYVFDDSIEYEYKFKGEYGSKGEKRSKKAPPTPEQRERQNQKVREKKMRRLIKANFKEGDLWITLKYPKGTKKTMSEVKKDISGFLKNLRRKYKKAERPLKFIYRIEIGRQGGVHIHMIANRISNADKMIQDTWKHGRVSFEHMYDSEGFRKLAAYIVKKTNIDNIPKSQQKDLTKYSSSRNLIRPVPERKKYRRRTVRKLITSELTPTKGYYIDKNSIEKGINPFTGMSYLYYTEYKLKGG